jgi:D-inositol-3-phosphate glycosyltransferase
MTVSRIAVLAYHSSPLLQPGAGDAGGMTVYVRSVAEAMAATGVRTDIFTRATGRERAVTELAPGVRVVAISAGPPAVLAKEELGAHIDEFVQGVRAFATAQRVRYEVVHSHYWQSGLAARELARAWDVPMVHSNHTLGKVKNRWLAPGDVPEPLSRLQGEGEVIAAADALIASTDEEWQQLACLYGAHHDRLKTVYPGVDHALFAPGDRAGARAALDVADEAVVLYVGRIQPLKGIDLAIRAAEQLVPALDRPLAFLVVGGASGARGEAELERLHELTRDLGISDAVRFVGARPHTDLPVFYRAADVVVVCSHNESFGLAALEAHACGTPVVATAVGGLSHIVRDGETGHLVDSRDPAIFAARLKTILSDQDLQQSFGRAAARSAASFSWITTAALFVDLYDCLLTEQYPEVCTC